MQRISLYLSAECHQENNDNFMYLANEKIRTARNRFKPQPNFCRLLYLAVGLPSMRITLITLCASKFTSMSYDTFTESKF